MGINSNHPREKLSLSRQPLSPQPAKHPWLRLFAWLFLVVYSARRRSRRRRSALAQARHTSLPASDRRIGTAPRHISRSHRPPRRTRSPAHRGRQPRRSLRRPRLRDRAGPPVADGHDPPLRRRRDCRGPGQELSWPMTACSACSRCAPKPSASLPAWTNATAASSRTMLEASTPSSPPIRTPSPPNSAFSCTSPKPGGQSTRCLSCSAWCRCRTSAGHPSSSTNK